MYHQYFGLREPAFSIAVNPRYLYMSAQHKEALAHLLYGVRGGGFVLLSGEVGTGKTTIIRSLLEQLPDKTDIAMVFNPMADVPEMLAMICDELGVKYVSDEQTVKFLTDSLHLYLLNNHRKGRSTVLLIDEAQLLSADALEQIRLLTNLETDTKKLLQIILVGQPELNTLLSQPRLRQLSQRITARFHLLPLSLAETDAYIAHRLQVAGLSDERSLFPRSIVKKIHRVSGGIPRRINMLCERALVGLYGHNKQQVDNATFQLAKREVMGGLEQPSSKPSRGLVLSLALGAALAMLVWLLWPTSAGPNSSQPGATEVKAELTNSYFTRLQRAQQALFAHTGQPARQSPCVFSSVSPYRCDTKTLASWAQLRELNRPVLLTLTTPDKFTEYALLVGLEGRTGTLITPAGERQQVALSQLARHWDGTALYLWYQPEHFSGPVAQGDRGPLVAWLAQQFAQLDGQERQLTNDRFNEALTQRLKIFQRESGLTADGVLGRQTLLKLNEVLELDTTLELKAD